MLENEKIKLLSVKIKSFRNLENVKFNIDGQSGFVYGTNHLGKTNFLNACLWCLTGADIDNCSNDSFNVPYRLLKGGIVPSTVLVDVEVVLSVGTIRRTISDFKGSFKQTIYVNGIAHETVRDGEIEIDKVLGILPLTIGQPSGFSIRRFLLNPMYLTKITESTLRAFFMESINMNDKNALVYSELPAFSQTLLSPYFDKYSGDPSYMNSAINGEFKTAKKQLEMLISVKAYLNQVDFTNDDLNKKVEEDLQTFNSNCLNIRSTISALDTYAHNLSLVYENVIKERYPAVKIAILEKGKGENVWKDVCKPTIASNGLPLDLGSTSERILTCVSVLHSFCVAEKINHLPIFLDEIETLDFSSIDILKETTQAQVVGARVDLNSNIIQFGEF